MKAAATISLIAMGRGGALWTLLAMLQHGGVEARTVEAVALPPEVTIPVTARRFEFRPAEIVLRRNVPVVLELVSEDRTHGFNVPKLGLRADIEPGAPRRLSFTPDRVGRFAFHCDVFCGGGHEEMTGELVVTDEASGLKAQGQGAFCKTTR